jgi:hypothetical protein
MQYSHVFQYRGPIIRDDRRLFSLYHFVHPSWSQTRSNCICHAYILTKFREEKLFAAVIFDLLTSIGFSLSWKLLTGPAVAVAAMVDIV